MDEPLRVALTLEQCWHDIPGGTARTALDLAAGLDARDDVEVVGVAARHKAPPIDPWLPSVPVHHHKLSRVALYSSWHRRQRPRVERVVEPAAGKVDVVHATGMAVAATERPLVVTVHDLAFEHFPDHPTRWGLRFFQESMSAARERATAIICPSDATAQDCLRHGFDEGRLHVVPWGIDWPVAVGCDVEAARSAHALPDRYLLWVGTIEPRKNLQRLVAAFRRVSEQQRDLYLVLAGPTGWGDLPDGVGAVNDRILPIGFVRPEHLAGLYRGALATCYPSLLEGFGMPVLESMSQGTPVITSAATATSEVLGDGGIAVDPTDVGALAEAMRTFVDDQAERDRAGNRAERRAATMSTERMVNETLAVYRSVLT